MNYFSQFEQDRFLDEVVFNRKKAGFFIDVGAHDGISYSNSAFFEFQRNWTGICIEPNPLVFEKLRLVRSVRCENCGLGAAADVLRFTSISGYAEMLSGFTDFYVPEHKERIVREIEKHGGTATELNIAVKPLFELLTSNQVVDFMSIDTEGNELEVLKGIDFKNQRIRVFVIENNYSDNRVLEFLEKYGYLKVFSLDTDEVFVLREMYHWKLRFGILKWTIRKKSSRYWKRFFR